ncbi:MAG TPA: thiamine-phosphate synthase family protein [Candidatus Thermoplasmatota archaeon]|nr:thiamine-phosphate synthase family protein [Candidatus Thermoplasmatota archaeon]
MGLAAFLATTEALAPLVRALASRELAREGWSQDRIAQALGVTQSMVSRYLAAKPPPADALAARLAEELCRELQDPPSARPDAWAALVLETARSGADDALHDLLEAERALAAAAPLALVPQIGINLARAAQDATDPSRVAAFPGRIVEAAGRLVAPAPPAFGASDHLARCLLRARARDPAVQAMGSVRGGDDARRAAAREGLAPVDVSRRREARGDPDADFAAAVRAARPPILAVHDPGAFGIEPCLYVAGPSARDVARRIVAIERNLVRP